MSVKLSPSGNGTPAPFLTQEVSYMESRTTLNSFARLLKNRQEMRTDETRDQLKLIRENQKAAFLVRLFEQGQASKVQELATVG